MSEIELNLATALQKAGLLDRLMSCAQQAGVSLLGYLERCADASVIKATTDVPPKKTPRSSEEIWAEMMSQPWSVRYSELCEAYHEGGIGDLSGEELRELCRD